jgi:predicted acetyltransferase
MSIHLSRATINDCETLANYRIRFALELKGDQSSEIIEQLRLQLSHYFKTSISDGSCISFLASSNSEVVGIGSLMHRIQPGNFSNPSGHWGYIMNMYTVPEFRKQGVCKAILKALVEEGSKEGITAFELHATPTGEKVYLKNGFMIHREPTLRKFI